MKARRKAIQEGQRFEFSVAAPMTQVPADLPPHLKGTAQKYEPWVRAFSKTGFDFVAGDAGTSSLFGMAPFEWVDVCTNMGGSIPLASGASLAGRKALAVTGDFSFLSMGPLALLEAQRRALSLKVIVFCNQEAAATGGQGVNRDWVRASIPDGIEVMDFEGSPDPDSITQFANMTGLAVGLIHA